ncbi:hypothetical protein D3C72_738990 [compost metagenome]
MDQSGARRHDADYGDGTGQRVHPEWQATGEAWRCAGDVALMDTPDRGERAGPLLQRTFCLVLDQVSEIRAAYSRLSVRPQRAKATPGKDKEHERDQV